MAAPRFRTEPLLGLVNRTLKLLDADKGVVVLGDDAIEVEGGMPIRLHLAALGVNVEPMDAKGLSGKLVASSRCPSASGLSTP